MAYLKSLGILTLLQKYKTLRKRGCLVFLKIDVFSWPTLCTCKTTYEWLDVFGIPRRKVFHVEQS